jgi:hypothetical protein
MYTRRLVLCTSLLSPILHAETATCLNFQLFEHDSLILAFSHSRYFYIYSFMCLQGRRQLQCSREAGCSSARKCSISGVPAAAVQGQAATCHQCMHLTLIPVCGEDCVSQLWSCCPFCDLELMIISWVELLEVATFQILLLWSANLHKVCTAWAVNYWIRIMVR